MKKHFTLQLATYFSLFGLAAPQYGMAAQGAQVLTTAMSGAAFAASAYDSETSSWHFGNCSSERYHHCVLGAMFLAQAGMMLAGGKEAKDRAGQFSYNPNLPTYPINPYEPIGGNNNPKIPVPGANPGPEYGNKPHPEWNNAVDRYNRAQGQMRDTGWDIRNGQIVAPNGKSMPLSGVGDPSVLAGMGLNASQISQIQDELAQADKKAKDKIKVLAVATEGGGGGGGASKGAAGFGQGDGFDMDAYMKKLMEKKGKRGPASVAGMNKSFGSDRIGVAGDNIFSMIQRRYSAKYKANHFIKEGTLKPKADSPYQF